MYPREESVSYLAHRVLATNPKPHYMSVAKHDAPCVLCGRQIRAGEPVQPWGDNGTFMNWSAMALPVESHDWDDACEDCAALQGREAMQRYNKSVICEQGLFPFLRLNDQAYWLIHPPEPPFAIALATTSNQQHIWWRGTVNHSRDVFVVQHGERARWINHDRVVTTARQVRQAWEANDKKMPFRTDLKSNEPYAFEITAKGKGGAQYIWPDPSLPERLAAMRPDDFWAVMVITLSKGYRELGEDLEQPEPIER